MLIDETAALVESGDATLVLDDGYEPTPRHERACSVVLYVQSDSEVSLWPSAPGTDRAPTIDVYDKDARRLVEKSGSTSGR